ncbi:hypothetical protein H6P81_019248 [Aristolochia fimbriata]|uniref:Uncharacterized protein n=1 Tax=Aristolochia fimbriata TaxID=158543 RepID=A0AAV7DVV8_ARIFI|nr:hypothetical protein H6P81_019248 [Aristolochia fimbriata]
MAFTRHRKNSRLFFFRNNGMKTSLKESFKTFRRRRGRRRIQKLKNGPFASHAQRSSFLFRPILLCQYLTGFITEPALRSSESISLMRVSEKFDFPTTPVEDAGDDACEELQEDSNTGGRTISRRRGKEEGGYMSPTDRLISPVSKGVLARNRKTGPMIPPGNVPTTIGGSRFQSIDPFQA